MAFRFGDSFDHYTTNAQVLKKWTSVGGGTISVVVGGGRNGTNALRNTESVDYFVTKTLDYQTTWIVGIAILYNNAPDSNFQCSFEWRDGGTAQIGWYVNNDQTISIRRGGSGGAVLQTTANSITTGSYNFFEFKVTIDNSGSYQLKVNGSSWASGSTDTQNTGNPSANVFALRLQRSNQSYVDDLYICDGTTGDDPEHPNNDFLGDVRVALILPNAAGTYSEFTPTSGANYTCVDETTPNDDTDYVYTSGVGNRDTYNYASLPVTSGTILGVQIIPYARKDDAGGRIFTNTIYYNGTLYSGLPQSLGDSYTFFPEIFEVNPDTEETWTVSEINSAEFGEKLES